MRRDRQDAWAYAARCPAKPVPVNAVTGSKTLFSGRAVLSGWQLFNSGSAGTVTIYDGQDANGTIVGEMNLPSSGTPIAGPGFPGVKLLIGLFVVVATGTVTGAFWIQPVDEVTTEGEATRPHHQAAQAG